MTGRNACSATRSAFVAPRFAPQTACNSCYVFISYGSHIREGIPASEPAKAHIRTQHPQAENTRNSVTTRPARKNTRFGGVQSYASKRYNADRRTA